MRTLTVMYLLLLLCCTFATTFAQEPLNQKTFFNDTTAAKATLVTDLGNLMTGKIANKQQPGNFTLTINNNTFAGNVAVNARGNMRRETCKVPPLKIRFSSDTTSPIKKLGSLKLVLPCESFDEYQQYLLKEYLAYKMLNLVTDYSFKVRLIEITLKDSKAKRKDITQYAFFIEDIDQLAKRNNCKALGNIRIYTDATNRLQTTLVSIFEYMIGNTDWSIPADHNIKFIQQIDSPTAAPIVVPYDFDYSGIVNPPYATPDPILHINFVTERLYRGFERTMDELQPIVQKFKDQQPNMYALVENCTQLSANGKKQVIRFLDGFFDELSKPSSIKKAFIENARSPTDN